MKNKYQILAVLIVICLLLLSLLSYHFLSDPAKFWFCSPVEPRGDDVEAWQKTIVPVKTTEEPDEDFFDNFAVSSDSDYFKVEHPSENPPDNLFAFELHEMTPGLPLDIGGGTLKLSCIGTAYHDANQTMPDENDEINNLFDVYVPYIMLNDSGQLEEFLRHTLQLNSSRFTGPILPNSFKNSSFPFELRNVTIRDIAKLYSQGGYLLSIDIGNDRLLLEYPVPLWVKIKQFLRRLNP